MLSLKIDFRSGQKLEIVIPVLNEKERLSLILDHYKNMFDFVVMDGGSDQETIEWMKANQITIYERTTDGPSENHFVYYANELSKSGKSFYLMADEYVEKKQLADCSRFLFNNDDGKILCFKYEWVYGMYSKKNKSRKKAFSPRGFCKGQAVYDKGNLHASLKYKKSGRKGDVFNCDLHHLHVWSTKSTFGKAGLYANIEVEEFIMSGNFFKNFFRRFIYYEMILLPKRMWEERERGPIFLLWMFLISLSVFAIGLMCWIELKYFPDVEKQKKIFSSLFVK